MLVAKEIAQKFAELFLELAKRTAEVAHKYIEEHDNINGYYKYPVKMNIFSKKDPQYAELFEKVPFLAYDIPKYRMEDFPKDTILYSAIFNGYAKDCVDCTILNEFDLLMDYIRPFVAERLLRFLAKELRIDILVPICLATFEEDTIKLSDNIEIKRMSDEIQKSRQQACSYEASNEDWVATCATHMLVLHNYHFKNTGDNSINSATKNYNSYPLKEIDKVIASIKVISGYSIGYAQILSHPIEWIDGFCADLIPLYGAKAHFVNPNETEKFWMHLPVSKISSEQSNLLQIVYKNILKCEEDANKSNLLFALNRFNRCMLRNEVDDMATDATIGIEALLAGGTKGEITYTISNRIPVVFAHEQSELYTPSNSRAIMKTIYNYRSKIVHGGKLKEKDKFVEIGGVKYDVAKIAVDFLRYALLFMTEHQEFLDAKKFDEYIDGILPNEVKKVDVE